MSGFRLMTRQQFYISSSFRWLIRIACHRQGLQHTSISHVVYMHFTHFDIDSAAISNGAAHSIATRRCNHLFAAIQCRNFNASRAYHASLIFVIFDFDFAAPEAAFRTLCRPWHFSGAPSNTRTAVQSCRLPFLITSRDAADTSG